MTREEAEEAADRADGDCQELRVPLLLEQILYQLCDVEEAINSMSRGVEKALSDLETEVMRS